ncbi:MAG: tetratricopeptide (TPR) repeat protein [Myxococcota bacterium]
MTAVLPEIAGFEVHSLLGIGGMGAVYSATATGSGTAVAVKVLLPQHGTGNARHRFEREARAMMRVEHPNICRALDYGALPDGRLYLVMEQLVGEDLSSRLERDAWLGLSESVGIALDVGRGLAAAHRVGLVHRDIKPSNIFLHQQADGTTVVKVLDFGLAVAAAGNATETRVTRTGEVLGTPAYMAPEQARGERAEDERTDIYALGAVLYHLLTAQPPFGRGSMIEVIIRLLTDTIESPEALRPAIPGALATELMRALSREPEARHGSMAEFVSRFSVLFHRLPADSADEPAPHSPESGPITLVEECRVLTVVLANGVEDCPGVLAEIRQRGGDATMVGPRQVVGVFGSDAREGDEAGRAVEAALAAESRCTVIGVGTGRAVGGRGHYSGNVLASAAEATMATQVGVSIDAETRRRVEGQFVLDGDRVSGVTASGRAQLPLVGRDVEVSDLTGRICRAFEDEEPASILLTGPPGVGKSRIAQAVVERVLAAEPDTQVLSAGCSSSRRFHSWWLLAAGLRELAGLDEMASPVQITRRLRVAVERAELPDWTTHLLADALGVPIPPGISPVLDAARSDPKVKRDQLVGAVGDILESLTRDGPLLVVFEDVHVADSPSLQAIETLVHRLDRAPLAIVLTARNHAVRERPEIFESPEFRQVPVRELSRRAAERLVVTAGVSESAAAAIVSHAGGNPLFLEEIAREMSGHLSPDFDSDDFAMPLTVEEAVQSRLDHLGDSDKGIVKCAAVFGTRFWPEGLEALQVGGLAGGLRRLERDNLVAAERRRGLGGGPLAFAFRSGVVRDAAYAMLTPKQMRTLHLQAGRWLASATVTTRAEAAEHLRLGGDEAAAMPLWVQSAEEAHRDGDVAAALDCLSRALPAAIGGPEERRVRLMRLRVAAGAGELDVAEVEAEALTDLFGEAKAEELAQYLYWTAAVFQWRGDYAGSRDRFADAAQAFDMLGDSVNHSRALAAQSVQMCTGRLGPAKPLALRAVEVAGDDPAARARALHALQYVQSYEESVAAARDAANIALTACEEAGDLGRSVEVMIALAALELDSGQHGAAAARLEEVLARSQRIGNRNAEGYALHNLGVVAYREQSFDAAILRQQQALTLSTARRHRRLSGAAEYYLALCYLEGPDPDGNGLKLATEHADRGLELSLGTAEESAARIVRAMVHRGASEVGLGLQELARAMALRQSGSGAAELDAELYACRVDLLRQMGRVDEAEQCLKESRVRLLARADELTTSPADRERFLKSTAAHRLLIG